MPYRYHLILILWVCQLTVVTAQQPAEIERQLASIFDDPAFARALWGVKVQSVDSGATYYEKDSEKLLMPASNMKLLTAVAAVEQLGLDFRYRTELRSQAEIASGILSGDLVVMGSGDPSLGARLSSPDPESLERGDPLQVFRAWAAELKGQGVRRIAGDLVGDDSIFDRVPLGSGWSWEDLPYGYSAELSGLQFNENVVLLKIVPAPQPGSPPVVEMLPSTSYLQVSVQLETVPAWEEWDYTLERRGGPNRVVLSGTVPAGEGPFWRTVSVEDATSYFLTVLREVLEAEGISVEGSIRRAASPEATAYQDGSWRTLVGHESPDLRFILRVLLKISQNLYAETLVKTLDEKPEMKSYERGREVVERILTRVGIPGDSYQLADGSGLSRLNLITAEMLVRLMRYVHQAPYGEEFRQLLPVAGRDGTLRSRLRGSVAEGQVHAKTGTLSQVRALAGFVTTRDGETLAFATIVNHYLQNRRSAEHLQDLALQYLASLDRKGTAVGSR